MGEVCEEGEMCVRGRVGMMLRMEYVMEGLH